MFSAECKKNWSNPMVILTFLVVLFVGIIIIVSILREAIVNNNQWQVSVAGQGRVSYTPDIANINMEVLIDKKQKPEEALNLLNEKVKKVFSAIKSTGLQDADIQTQNYTLTPQYEVVKDINTLTGYTANQNIIVKVRDIDKNPDRSAKIISVANQAGINKINGVTFEASNINDIKQEARLKAITDARSKAGSLANALGVKLGKTVSWWENYIAPDAQYSLGVGGGEGKGGGGISEPNISSGTREVVVEVNISYLIK
jgi:uncharacterized protein